MVVGGTIKVKPVFPFVKYSGQIVKHLGHW